MDNDQPHRSAPLFEFNRPTVIVLFYIAAIFTVFTAVIGVVLAYVWRSEAGEAWEQSHFAYLIRTFWISVLAMLLAIGFLVGVIVSYAYSVDQELAAVVLGFAAMAGLTGAGILLAVRCVLSLIRAQTRQAMLRPKSWLI